MNGKESRWTEELPSLMDPTTLDQAPNQSSSLIIIICFVFVVVVFLFRPCRHLPAVPPTFVPSLLAFSPTEAS